MKKVLLTMLVASAAVALFAVPANADEVSNDTTDLGISFDTNGDNKPGEGPFKDNLAIAWVPSRFDFGKQKATGNVATYNAASTDNKQYFVVNDDRTPDKDGSVSAWKASATLSEFKTTGDDTGLNATLSFNLGNVQKYDIGTTIDETLNDYTPQDPTASGVLTAFNPVDPSIVLGDGSAQTVTLDADAKSSVTILGKKEANPLKGGFATEITDQKLKVTASKEAAGKSYSATLSWSLNNTY